MRVLILSCNTGEGHNSCAKAIKEVLDIHNVDCDILDVLEFVSHKTASFIAWGHSTMYRYLPWLFRYGYKYFEKHPKNFDENRWVYNILSKASKPLYEHIEKEKYDYILCVHIFSSLIMTDVSKKFNLEAKTAFVATDYTCSPSVKNSNLDYYFIPDESLADEFRCDTIPKEKMIFSGIPIRQRFYSKMPKDEAKEMFGIENNHSHLVIMCGSMGCGPIKKLVYLFSKDKDADYEVSVVCGTNKRLYEKLNKKCIGKDNIHIRGYEKNMSCLLDSADVYLTKPGGLSTSEAKAKGLPMVFIDAVAGCEEYNSSFFVKTKGAKSTKDVKNLYSLTRQLLSDNVLQKTMSNNLKSLTNGNSAEMIYNEIINIAK